MVTATSQISAKEDITIQKIITQTKMKKVYAIIGRKRTGKDTVADYMCERLGAKKYALATPIKEWVAKMLGITLEDLDKYKNENWNMSAFRDNKTTQLERCAMVDISFRSILQNAGENIKDFFGLECFMRKSHEVIINNDTTIIPDVRLKIEQDWLIANTNVTFIKLIRDTELDKDSLHKTETETDSLGYDCLVDNNGNLEDLAKQIDLIINK